MMFITPPNILAKIADLSDEAQKEIIMMYLNGYSITRIFYKAQEYLNFETDARHDHNMADLDLMKGETNE